MRPGRESFVTRTVDLLDNSFRLAYEFPQKLFDSLGQNFPESILRPGRESNPCMEVLQTSALPLRHLAGVISA